MRILFLYPNFRGMNMLPPAIGILSAVLKKAGHEVKLFDTAYYESLAGDNRDPDAFKSDRLMGSFL